MIRSLTVPLESGRALASVGGEAVAERLFVRVLRGRVPAESAVLREAT